jgi:hypothetical protein
VIKANVVQLVKTTVEVEFDLHSFIIDKIYLPLNLQ